MIILMSNGEVVWGTVKDYGSKQEVSSENRSVRLRFSELSKTCLRKLCWRTRGIAPSNIKNNSFLSVLSLKTEIGLVQSLKWSGRFIGAHLTMTRASLSGVCAGRYSGGDFRSESIFRFDLEIFLADNFGRLRPKLGARHR